MATSGRATIGFGHATKQRILLVTNLSESATHWRLWQIVFTALANTATLFVAAKATIIGLPEPAKWAVYIIGANFALFALFVLVVTPRRMWLKLSRQRITSQAL